MVEMYGDKPKMTPWTVQQPQWSTCIELESIMLISYLEHPKSNKVILLYSSEECQYKIIASQSEASRF